MSPGDISVVSGFTWLLLLRGISRDRQGITFSEHCSAMGAACQLSNSWVKGSSAETSVSPVDFGFKS